MPWLSSQVYKGLLVDGTAIAVKKLDRKGMQGDKEFAIEVNLLNTLQHPNIVRLLGICSEGDHRLAVFELATKVGNPYPRSYTLHPTRSTIQSPHPSHNFLSPHIRTESL